MKTHKIHWPGKHAPRKQDIDIDVIVDKAVVVAVSHPVAWWAEGKWWHEVSKWFQGKGAKITLQE